MSRVRVEGTISNGLCMGAGSAQLLRQLMLDQPTLVDAKAYSPERLQNKILA